MQTKVRLTRIESNHGNLRTPVVVGWLHTELEVGQSIIITAEPIVAWADVRCITTTPIRRIDGHFYYTDNSVYEIIPEGDPDGN